MSPLPILKKNSLSERLGKKVGWQPTCFAPDGEYPAASGPAAKSVETVINHRVVNRVHIVASLPCYLEDNVEYQRGKGSYNASMEAGADREQALRDVVDMLIEDTVREQKRQKKAAAKQAKAAE